MTQPTAIAHTSMTDAPQSRHDLRKILLQKRRNLDASLKQQWDAELGQKLQAYCAHHQITSLGVYWPIKGEPDLRDAYGTLAAAGMQLALPLIETRQQPLVFLDWKPGDPMLDDEYGIPVPAQRSVTILPAALIIPCVGFNAQNFRLGYGGGYYDRTLEKLPRPLTLGIAYQCTLADFAAGEHDIAMDDILIAG
ncbi:5-formyltetrahydrofolate cyclo-ligase [Undibacterium sp. TJN19]|uniref:5-formyltetrahydrofolate cyclo-ligase n=1 Tax=Undibacterium sp. TJN19 TaxID=3413055 RepID=UPI003BF39A62